MSETRQARARRGRWARYAPAGLAIALLLPAPALAQQAVTLEDAVAMALARSPSLVVAGADSAAAYALLMQARAVPNPTVTAQYTRSTPTAHFEVEQPLVFPWIRSARVSATQQGSSASTLRLDLERARLVRDVEVAYAQAAAAERRRDLSARSAGDAAELVTVARRRMEAGDASELEVALARVAAGESINQAASDSLDAVSAVLELQRLLGEPPDRVTVSLADSLTLPLPAPGPAHTVPLAVTAARADVRAGEASLTLARRSRFPAPGLVAGFETRDPTGSEPGLLPVLGLVLSVPLFNQSGGEVRQARAELERARGTLDLVERESAAAVAMADRERAAARARAERDRTLLDDAEQVARLANRAYQEGAFPITSVLEAQRAARDARIRYVEDLAAARVAEADYMLATRTRRVP